MKRTLIPVPVRKFQSPASRAYFPKLRFGSHTEVLGFFQASASRTCLSMKAIYFDGYDHESI